MDNGTPQDTPQENPQDKPADDDSKALHTEPARSTQDQSRLQCEEPRADSDQTG
jgi:hypothetical protein